MIRFLFVALAVFIQPVVVQAQAESPAFVSGAYLYRLCGTVENGKEIVEGAHNTCQSYIAGVIDYHKLLRSLNNPPPTEFCVPNTTKLNDLQNIVFRYLDANNHNDPFNAATGVALALSQAFPCKKKR
ncbi:MAG: Rap1a/Tai family immunity protein [Pseudomonadota bacterium]